MDGTQNPNAAPNTARAPKQRAASATPRNSGGGFLGSLKVGQKLAVIALFFTVPIAVLLYLLVNEQNKAIEFAAKERRGVEYLGTLDGLFKDLSLHRSLTDRLLTGNAGAAQPRANKAAQIDAGFERLNALDQKYGAQFNSTARLNDLRQSWKDLEGRLTKLEPKQSFLAHSAIIQDRVLPLILEVGNNSNLILDPDLDSYYTMDLVVNKLSSFVESLGQFEDAAIDPLEARSFSDTNRAELISAINQVKAQFKGINLSFGYAMGANPTLQAGLDAPVRSAQAFATQALDFAQKKLIDTPKPTVTVAEYSAVVGKAIDAYNTLYDASLPVLDRLLQQRIERFQVQQRNALGLSALAVLLAVGLVVWVSRLITTPVAQLARASERVSDGDLETQVEVQSDDELGRLATTFNATVRQLKLRAESDAQVVRQRDELQANIGEFLNVTMDISQGDLTKKGRVSDDVLGNVVDAINVMTEEIGYLLKDVERVAQQVNDGSNDVSTTNQAILQGAQSQAGIAQKARAQALEVTNSIRATAQKALETAQAAQQTLAASQQGQTALQETLSGMQNIRREVQGISRSIKALSDRSLEISEITETISGIAAQTNMLALNAAIEASGAGEAGARFAIVADEVRKLAEDSARATGRVTNLIKNIQNEIQSVVIGVEGGTREVEQGYKIATQAGERLKEISLLANQSAVLVQTISSATRAQAGSVEQVKNAVEVIAQTASQAEAQSTQGRQSAESLRKLSQELTSSLSRFQLPS
jgi:twitching motility protein PilJ